MIARALACGTSVVLSGLYGSGRTTLLREVQRRQASRYRFVPVPASPRLAALKTVLPSIAAGVVIVIDDVTHVATVGLRLLAAAARQHAVCLVVVEKTVSAADVLKIRASLGGAVWLRLQPLSQAAMVRYLEWCVTAYRLSWSRGEVRLRASVAHGWPLGARLQVDAARRAVAAEAQR